MSTLCVLLVFVATSRSASIEEDFFDETKIHPLSDAYIEYINNVQSLWQAGRNFEVDTPIEYLRQLTGAKRKGDRSGLKEKEFPVDMIQDLPESFDAREHWPDCPSLSEIRSQGNCGSCWAISTTEVITDRTCIASHGKVQFHYSTFDLLTCCVNCSDGCKYGIPGKAWEHWIHNGIVSGGNYDSKDKGCKPYPFPNNYNYSLEHGHFDDKNISLNCTNKCVSSDIDYNKDKHFGKTYFYMSKNEDQIKTEILNHGPVQATFDIYFDFINYRSGIYRAVANQRTNASHAVKILGWGVENATKYWLIANSWGEKWGENGYFRIVRGENHCNIESDIYAGEPLL